MQVCLRVDQLLGLVPLLHSGHNSACRPSSLYVTAELSSSGHSLGVQLRTPFAECAGQGPSWNSLLKFPIKVILSESFLCLPDLFLTRKESSGFASCPMLLLYE